MGTLTEAEKISTRRFCGYPVAGGAPNSFTSYRFFQAYGTLEFRLNNMAAGEETVLRAKLAALALHETSIDEMGCGLDTESASVWTRNKRELADRLELYTNRRLDLCEFIGVPPYGPLVTGGSRSVRVLV